ncbi:hypothetical protein M885DRAFT_616045 [Pelagophyceae sp. CCMP2097]|nr:hypothetical protein M885DRAFT_616045 [Pelagophyceae sp. CCMP2097]
MADLFMIRNSDTGEMMALDLATGEMRRQDGSLVPEARAAQAEEPAEEAAAPTPRARAPARDALLALKTAGRKAADASNAAGRRVGERVGDLARRSAPEPRVERGRAQLVVLADGLRRLDAALREQAEAARRGAAARANVRACLRRLAAGSPVEDAVEALADTAEARDAALADAAVDVDGRVARACAAWRAEVDGGALIGTFVEAHLETRRAVGHYRAKVDALLAAQLARESKRAKLQGTAPDEVERLRAKAAKEDGRLARNAEKLDAAEAAAEVATVQALRALETCVQQGWRDAAPLVTALFLNEIAAPPQDVDAYKTGLRAVDAAVRDVAGDAADATVTQRLEAIRDEPAPPAEAAPLDSLVAPVDVASVDALLYANQRIAQRREAAGTSVIPPRNPPTSPSAAPLPDDGEWPAVEEGLQADELSDDSEDDEQGSDIPPAVPPRPPRPVAPPSGGDEWPAAGDGEPSDHSDVEPESQARAIPPTVPPRNPPTVPPRPDAAAPPSGAVSKLGAFDDDLSDDDGDVKPAQAPVLPPTVPPRPAALPSGAVSKGAFDDDLSDENSDEDEMEPF